MNAFRLPLIWVLFLMTYPLLAQERLTLDNAVLKIVEERQIPCQASGVLRGNQIREGTLLKEGDVITEIDNSRAKLELSKLKRELEMAMLEAGSRVEIEYIEKTIEVAQAELSRAQRANERLPGNVAQSEIDQLKLVVEKSIAEKKKAEFNLGLLDNVSVVRQIQVELGEKSLADHTIKSPISGMIVEVVKKSGEWVEVSEPVAKIVRLDILKTEVNVPAEIAIKGLSNSTAIFRPRLKALQSKEYPAKVLFVHPEANPVNQTVRVWFQIENEKLELIPGINGSLEIILAEVDAPQEPARVEEPAKIETSNE